MAPFETVNIPQKPPMVMVDKLIRAEEGVVETTFLILEENVFCEKGFFTEAGLVENMAQTAAAGIGASLSTETDKPPVGIIGGIRNLKISEYPEVGQKIHTTVEILHEVLTASVVKATVFLHHTAIAESELKIFLIE